MLACQATVGDGDSSGTAGGAGTAAGSSAGGSATSGTAGASAMAGASGTAGTTQAGAGGVAGGAGSGGGSAGYGSRPTVEGAVVPDVGSGLPPSYHYELYRFPEPNDDVACTETGNDTAAIEHVFFGQTHVMEPSWPLFFLVADRPALLEVIVTGQGTSPAVRVEGWLGTKSLGSLCLAGPMQLPATVSTQEHRWDDRFVLHLPKAWMQPGLRLEVTAGKAKKTLSPEELKLQSAPELNLFMVPIDVLNYNDGKSDIPVPANFLPDFASAVPASKTRFGNFPARLTLPSMVVSGSGPNGQGVPPLVLEKRLCNQNETPASAPCTDTKEVEGGDVNAAALRFISAILRATGDYAYSYIYGNTENFFPGGWGGGKTFVGADFTDVFIHEMGHALSLPHWGQGAFQNTMPNENEYQYPYGGIKNDGGGRGDTWNYYQNTSEFVSPICNDPKQTEVFGKERSDAMFRSSKCDEWRTDGRGPWDGFSDFSSYAIHRFMAGAGSEMSGTVPYQQTGGDAPFHLSKQGGFPTLKLDAQGKRQLVREPGFMPEVWEQFDFLTPQKWDVPVYTIVGSYHPQYTEANILYEPMSYTGNLPKVLDPTDAATFSELAAGGNGPYEGYFWWSKDMTFKFTYEDGSVLHALYPYDSVDRNWTLGSGPWRGDLLYYAITIPADKKLKKIELYRRPFLVRNKGMTDEGNVANPALGITASNFMDAAELVVSKDL
jgi:hypothetical protein